MTKKLRRSKTDKIFFGVCGGIGEFFNIDPIFIRIIWSILLFVSDTPAVLMYIICVIVIPEESNEDIYRGNNSSAFSERKKYNSQYSNKNNTIVYLGLALILIGTYMLIKIIFPEITFQLIRIKRYWPVLLIILGIYLIANRNKNK